MYPLITQYMKDLNTERMKDKTETGRKANLLRRMIALDEAENMIIE